MPRTPSKLQRNTAKAKLDNPELSGGKLVEAGGYRGTVIRTPGKALESQGYKQALADFGLTEELVSTALVDDIKAKPLKRYAELNLGAEILGMKKHETENETKKTVVAVQVILNGTDNAQNRTDEKAV